MFFEFLYVIINSKNKDVVCALNFVMESMGIRFVMNTVIGEDITLEENSQSCKLETEEDE